MFNIQTLNKIAPVGLEILQSDKYNISESDKDVDGIILRSASMHDMELPATLKAVARAGAGTNNIPIDKCSEKGIVVFNTPGANANAVKELVVAGLLLSSRKICEGIEWAKTLKGADVPKLVEKGKGQFVGPEIARKKIGVIGLGAIGVLVANACKSLGMDVLGFDPYISVESAWGLSRSVKKCDSLDTVIAESDYITLHLPLIKETRGMFNAECFSKFKKGARLLNFSRNELVNNADLLAAIKDGTVAKYVVDFPSDDLLGEENVICIPHLGASTPESEDNCAVMAALEMKDFLETGNIVNSVNFPRCELFGNSKHRIVVAHKNIPNMLSQISTTMANEKININDMLNKSKGDLAYTILDLTAPVSDQIADRIRNMDGMLSVRVIS